MKSDTLSIPEATVPQGSRGFTPLVSVVTPVYNVEKYLRECLDSIIAQSYENWKLILVDDASSDRSGEICDEYALRDERISVIHHEKNGGLSMARNSGIETADGDFITFIDSDDIISPEYLNILVNESLKQDADIVVSPLATFKASKELNNQTAKQNGRTIVHAPEEAVEKTLYQTTGLTCSSCGKLFRKSLWDGIRFTKGILYEDLDVFYKIFLKANKIVEIEDSLYYYRQNPDSILGVFNPKRMDVLQVTGNIVKYMETRYPDLLPAAKDRQLSAAFNILALALVHDYQDEELKNRCMSIIKKSRFGSLKNPKVRLKNKLGIIISYLPGFTHIMKQTSRWGLKRI